jgi:hypothetical protein
LAQEIHNAGMIPGTDAFAKPKNRVLKISRPGWGAFPKRRQTQPSGLGKPSRKPHRGLKERDGLPDRPPATIN